ncbi:hypothetical protein Tco_0499319 [Tanacetum coccineum]
MRTHSQSRNRQQQQVPQTFVEPFDLEEPIDNPAPPVVTMADNRTMAQLLQAPTEGYEDAIVVPAITANNFELKHDHFYDEVSKRPELPKNHREQIQSSSFTKQSNCAKWERALLPPEFLATFAEKKPLKIGEEPYLSTSKPIPSSRYVKAQGKLSNPYAVVLILTVIVPPPMATFIVTIFKHTLHKPPRLTTTKEIPVYPHPKGPTIPTTFPKVVERETEVTHDTVPPTNNGSTEDVQPPIVQVETHVPIFEPVIAPVSAPKPNPKPSIPYPSRLNDQKIREKANKQIEKFYQIFQDLHFDISFVDALILMPKFASKLKSLISNKEKLFELARTPLNEHCSVVLLKKLLEKHGDPGKFLIPCEFPGMDECLALADLGASINLMPLSVWKMLSLSEVTPTCMTLELADQSISRPIDPDVPLIDVYEGELTLRVGKEAVTFNLDQTSRYSSNYDDNSVNRINVIDMACEEYCQEFSVLRCGSRSAIPLLIMTPLVSTSSPTLISPFGIVISSRGSRRFPSLLKTIPLHGRYHS